MTNDKRARHDAVNAALLRDGRALRDVGVIIHQREEKWEAEVLARKDFVCRLYKAARFAPDEGDRETYRDILKWAGAIEGDVAPGVFVFADGTVVRSVAEVAQ